MIDLFMGSFKYRDQVNQIRGGISGHKGVAYQILIAGFFITEMFVNRKYEKVKYCNFTKVDDIYCLQEGKFFYYQCKLDPKSCINEVIADFMEQYMIHVLEIGECRRENLGGFCIATQKKDDFLDKYLDIIKHDPESGTTMHEHLERMLSIDHKKQLTDITNNFNFVLNEIYNKIKEKYKLTDDKTSPQFTFLELMKRVYMRNFDFDNIYQESIEKLNQHIPTYGTFIYAIILSKLVHERYCRDITKEYIITQLKEFDIPLDSIEGATL